MKARALKKRSWPGKADAATVTLMFGQDKALRKRTLSGPACELRNQPGTWEKSAHPLDLPGATFPGRLVHLNLLQCEKLRGFGGRAPILQNMASAKWIPENPQSPNKTHKPQPGSVA